LECKISRFLVHFQRPKQNPANAQYILNVMPVVPGGILSYSLMAEEVEKYRTETSPIAGHGPGKDQVKAKKSLRANCL